MKNLILALLFVPLFITSCEKDDPAEPIDAELQHDGDNNTAPLLDPGTYTTAARFAAGVTNEYSGKSLTEVDFHIAAIPNECILKVYDEGTQNRPGQLLYSAEVTNQLNSDAWNTHTLNTPVEITGDDIWLAIEFTQNQRTQTIGCDAGPAVSGGDWIFTEVDNDWLTFRVLTGGENINWNIRGQIE